jgi:hypothetical protein
MPADHLNIHAEVPRGQVTLIPDEHSDDRAARLRTEARRDLIRDCTDLIVFIVLMVAIVTVGVIGAYEGFWDTSASPETKRWSQTVLSAVMTGGISFVAGRKIGNK